MNWSRRGVAFDPRFARASASDRALTGRMAEQSFQGQVCEFIELLRGRWMHVHPLRKGDKAHGGGPAWRTPTNVAWPDLSVWFPFAGGGLHLVELKADDGVLSDDQTDAFGSLSAAGVPVHLWRPRDWGSLVEPTLRAWARGEPG